MGQEERWSQDHIFIQSPPMFTFAIVLFLNLFKGTSLLDSIDGARTKILLAILSVCNIDKPLICLILP